MWRSTRPGAWMWALAALCGALGVLAPAPSADASGLFIPGHGARSMGRGGTGVVGVWDLNALWYNPSLLSGIGEHTLMVDFNVVSMETSFLRQPREYANGEVRSFQAVENTGPALPIPQLGFASRLGTERWTFAVGVTAPNGAVSIYPEDGPQRYSLVGTDGTLFVQGMLGVSFRATDWLWVGGTLQNHSAALRVAGVAAAYPGVFGDPEDEDLDAFFVTEFQSLLNVSGSLGAWASVGGGVELGASVQLPVSLEDDAATIQTRLPSHPYFDDAKINGDRISGTLELPWVARFGARYVHKDRFDVEVNAVYERWSVIDEISFAPQGITVTDVRGVGDYTLKPVAVPRNHKDTWSVRAGSDFKVWGPLTGRVGALWEQGSLPTETLSVLVVDTDKWGLTLGGSVELHETWTLDLSYGHLFYADADVTDSQIKQINVANEEGALVVGNGTYEASVDMFGVGVRAEW